MAFASNAVLDSAAEDMNQWAHLFGLKRMVSMADEIGHELKRKIRMGFYQNPRNPFSENGLTGVKQRPFSVTDWLIEAGV
jgi:hypothetical protein